MRDEDHQSAPVRDESRKHKRHGRHVHWFTSAAFATIALVALLQEIGDVNNQWKKIKWSVAGISIALSLAILGVLASMSLRHKFVGTHLEGALALMTVGIWAAVLPALMNPEGGVATGGRYGEVLNPNLYFFSWGATIMSLLALASFIRKKFSRSPSRKFMFSSWAALILTSFVTMMAATRVFQNLGCKNVGSAVCNRTKFAIILGGASGFIALIWLCICAYVTIKMLDTLMACLFLAAWCVGITYITFGGDKAPARGLSNLYFFTWGSFALSVALAAHSLYKMVDKLMDHGNDDNDDVVEREKVIGKDKELHAPNQRRDLEAVEIRGTE